MSDRVISRLRTAFGRARPAAFPELPTEEPRPELSGNFNRDIGLRDAALSGWYNQERSELFSGFPIGPGDIVADIGCGDGGNAGFCARMGARLILADVDAATLEQARANVVAKGGVAETHLVSDAAPLPIADAAATRVVATEVLEHVADPRGFLGELARIGRPGALYLLACPDPASEDLQKKVAPESYFQHPNHIRIISHDEFAAMVTEAGLVIERRAGYGAFWSIWLALFWDCKVDLKTPDHPLLTSWTKTWELMLDMPEGQKLKQALDATLPKSQVIVARKPA